MLRMIHLPKRKARGMKFSDIRKRLERASEADSPHRNELIDTLFVLEQLESNFAILCREVALLSVDPRTKRFVTTGEFEEMLDSRGVEWPEIP